MEQYGWLLVADNTSIECVHTLPYSAQCSAVLLLCYASALLCLLLLIHIDNFVFGCVWCASVAGAGGCAGGN